MTILRRPNLYAGAATLGVLLFARSASAWTHNEHTRMTGMAIRDRGGSSDFPVRLHVPPLDASARRALDALWDAARGGDPRRSKRLCAAVDDDDLSDGRAPTCISMASLPAFAADHTCSPSDLGGAIVARDNWPMRVLGVAQRFDAQVQDIGTWEVAEAEQKAEIANARRDQDLYLLAVDEQYVSRAQDNRSHFQLPRAPDVATLGAYLAQALEAGAQINGTALYVVYHQRALRFAAAAAVAERAGDLAWWAVLNEAYALHFLEDAFAAGHIVGGSAWNEPDGLRLGTHDYYSAHGFPMVTWTGHTYPGFGDGFASEDDYVHAAAAVRESLRQLARAAGAAGRCSGDGQKTAGLCADEIAALNAVDLPEIDSCAPASTVPAGVARFARLPLMRQVLGHTPSPALRVPPPPMFVGESGFFVLASAAVTFGAPLHHGEPGDPSTRFLALAEAATTFGVGFATDGVTSGRRDSVFFGGLVGAAQARGSSSRLGVGVKIRLPYVLFPADIPLWPLYALLSPCGSFRLCFTSFAERSTRASSLLPLGFLPPIEAQFNERTTFKLDVGREASALVLFDPGAGRYAGWEVTVPYLAFRTHWFDRDIAGDDLFGLSLRFGDDREYGWFVGPSLTYTRIGRWYRQ
ncbi:hypothetical protein [Sorangium sp. So ce1000]|uniref:hypothetical protein n=1 Tax=Sorangium sp. So ce1000 TaxID=3133325 RepID=UPI003F6328CC